MTMTSGVNHIGLTVGNLENSTRFFVECLGWQASGHDPSYPRTAVSDGHVRLTLWQVDNSAATNNFDRRQNIGLHHLALNAETEAQLLDIAQAVGDFPGTTIEFMPELVGQGPRKHMMCYEPGGNRIEFIWSGE